LATATRLDGADYERKGSKLVAGIYTASRRERGITLAVTTSVGFELPL
jgi:hypothetical protein